MQQAVACKLRRINAVMRFSWISKVKKMLWNSRHKKYSTKVDEKFHMKLKSQATEYISWYVMLKLWDSTGLNTKTHL